MPTPVRRGPGRAGLLGRQTLRGLPFLIGNSEDESIALFGPGGHTAAVRIDVGQSVHSLTFAQVLLDSEVPRHGSPGNVVARYLFHFADGSKVTVKVRERFEIGWLSHERMMRPGEPYLALRDGDDGLQPRYAGPYDDSSRRITEASAGRVRAFFLWPWTNPKPDIPLSHVEITPARQRFVLGGISAGFAAEEPLRRTPRRPVLIELPDPGDAGKPFDLEVEVDRGTATYAQPLPKRPELFLNAQAKGYGEPNNTTSSPAYSEVAATPSANVTVRQGGEALGTARFGDLETRETVAASPPSEAAPGGGRPQLGPHAGGRRRDGQADSVPHSLPLTGGGALPALRSPSTPLLRSRHLVQGPLRRRAHGSGHLRLHGWRLPGLAAARAGVRGRCARLRVRAAANCGRDQAGATRAGAAPENAGRA